MGLGAAFLEAHIADWETKFGNLPYPHRIHWPSRLFHHTPLENAVPILQSGMVLSRNDSAALRGRDVAGAGVIDSSNRAHSFARFYFRPRTPTQYHIEGISRSSDRPSYCEQHAPILYMLVFDARSLLLLPDTRFSKLNMQTGAIEGTTEQYFSEIPFEKVYHEGGIGGDTSITQHRCAEVLATSPLPIEGKLQLIYCRSEGERVTLLNALGPAASKWARKMLVSDDLKVFQKRFTFVQSVSLSNDAVVFQLSPRYDWAPVAIILTAWDRNGLPVAHYAGQNLAASATPWRLPAKLVPGIYRVKIVLDGELAFDASLKLDNEPF